MVCSPASPSPTPRRPSTQALVACAGVVLQALLRNPLATPFTLGVSAGASLGAILGEALKAKNEG